MTYDVGNPDLAWGFSVYNTECQTVPIVGNILFGEFHDPCMLNTAFVDFRRE